jgi:MFS family permease
MARSRFKLRGRSPPEQEFILSEAPLPRREAAAEPETTPPPDAPDAGPPVQSPGAPPAPRAAPLPRGALAALRHRNFRLCYLGQLLSLVGTWMQSTAQGWLVLELTDSALLLGMVSAAGTLPVLLFTLYAGVLADRVDKRRVIVAAQAGAAAVALALAVLTDTGHVTVHWILALVFLLGTASAFEIPTRQSFFVELVGQEDLTSAIGLNSSAFSASRVVGPALAGALLGTVGIAACFYLNAVSYLAVIAGLLLIRLPPFRRPERTASTLANLREGFAFIRGDRLVRTLVWTIAALSVFGFPYSMLLPVFARDVLGVGAPGLGWLLAASGGGALAGGITLSALASRVPRGRLVLLASFSFALLVGAFAASRSFALSLLLLAGAGFCMILNNGCVNTLLQSLVPDRLRGRVMSVYVFMFLGMAPLGSLQAGALARWAGAPAALGAGAAVLALVVLGVAWKVPELRELR